MDGSKIQYKEGIKDKNSFIGFAMKNNSLLQWHVGDKYM